MPSMEQDQKIETPSQQSSERQAVAERVMKRLQVMDAQRSQKYAYLRNRTPLQAIEDSQKRVAQYKLRPAYKMPWQQNLAGSIITDKLFEVLAKLAARSMEVNVFPAEDVSWIEGMKARIANSSLKAAGRKNLDDFQLVMEMLEAMIKGTVVGFEGWRMYRRKIKDIIDFDLETGEEKFQEKFITEFNDVWGDIWPVERVLFGNYYVSHIQKMSDIGLERIVKHDAWKAEFGHLPDADKVLPRSALRNEKSTIFYAPASVSDDEVWEVRYYNQTTDEFVMIVNGIWVNPLGKASVRGIPYWHKKLPVWSARFRPVAVDFILGLSHPDTMIASSDTYDKVLENILDNLIIALNAPIVADENTKGLTDGYLHPNRVIRVKQGQRDPKRLDLSGLSAEGVNLLSILQNRLEQNSSSTNPTGSPIRKTATQINEEVDSALEMVALFLRFMEFGIRDKADLRLSNIFQYYSMPIKGDDGVKKHRKIILRNEPLTNGQMGTREITFTDEPSQERVMYKDSITPGNTEFIEASPEFVRDFKYELELVPNSSRKRSEALMQALELNKQRVIQMLHPQKFVENADQFYKDMLKVYNNDPDKYDKGQVSQNMETPPMQPGQPGQNPTLPSIPQEPSLKELVNA